MQWRKRRALDCLHELKRFRDLLFSSLDGQVDGAFRASQAPPRQSVWLGRGGREITNIKF